MAKFSQRKETYCYLDLDFDDSRASYKRAVDFVESNSIKYGLSSNVLLELGGREMKSVPELFANDYVWSESHPGRVITRPQRACRLVFLLDSDNSPLASENFFTLCTGSKGLSKNSSLPLSYLNTKIHRYNSSLGIIQGGDIQFGNGSGGESIWGKKFKDDVKGLKLKHDKRGVLSMGNGGKNSNTSQFFVCLKPGGAPVCDKKHVVFGQLVHGFDTLDLMQELIDATDGPPVEMAVTGCGEWIPECSPIQGYYDAADVFQEILNDEKETGG
eukprot:GSChrysophyteH1.ASY1.ANO1.3225.1 assembled CDS